MISKRVLTLLSQVFVVSLFLWSFWLIPPSARGQLYWDIPFPTPGPGGVWNLGNPFWSTSSSGGSSPPRIPWLNASDAVFSATDLGAAGNYTVTLAASVIVGNLTYRDGNLGSTLQIVADPGGNTITLATGQMNVTVGSLTTLVVGPNLVGVGSLFLQGGTLILTGANSYAGGTTISAGTLELGNPSVSGSIVGTVTNNDTFNIVHADTSGITMITNNFFGTTNFLNGSAVAGTTTIDNINGGVTAFFNTSTAGTAAITNDSGMTEFFDTSSADHAGITTTDGGFTEFFDSSTAGNAIITVNSGSETEFNNASNAGNSTITNSGGVINFNDTTTAASAVIINNETGSTNFNNTSTAGHATITNDNGVTNFNNASMAGNAVIANNLNGVTNFNNTSTAGHALIVNNGHGVTEFFATSTAGNSSITTNSDGETLFFATSTAANSTLTTNSGGETLFFATSTGGQARLITNAGGMVDLSALTSDGMTAGSIQGAGSYLLGSKSLTVGSNNLSTTVSGVIEDGGLASGTGGALIKVGTGTLTLTGLNTYSGGTSFNGGIVAVNSDANLGTGALSFNGGGLEALASGGGVTTSKAIRLNAGGGTFFADTGTTSTFSAAISGAGSLTKDGLGALDLAGNNIYQGGTILNAGTLTVNSAQALGLGNVTVNGGILRADPQPINVKGNYTQTAGGTLQLQVAGANAGQYDTLNVGGNAALGGTLQVISLGFQPKAGNQLTLVSTGGVVSGRFGQFIDPFSTMEAGFTIAGLIYNSNSVLLEFRSAASFALTPNQFAAASLIDAVHLEPGAANLIAFLNTEPFANLPGDFEKISPDGLTALYEISFSNANIQRLNLEGRMDDLHSGLTGFSSNMKVNGATVNLEERADADGKSSKAIVEPILERGPQNRWGVWVTGFGDFVSVDADANANGYSFTTGGVSLGIDYRITDQLVIGVMGEYSHTWTSLQPGGSIDVNSGRGGVYATWANHGIYLNAAIYGGYNHYDSSRSGLGGLATGSTEGAEFSTFISGGYDLHLGPLTVGPIAALQYTYVNVDGFGENGSLAPMEIESNSVNSLRSDVGFRIFCPWQIGKILLEPSLKAAWEHEYLYSALPVTAGFAGIPGPSATFFGPSEGHDSAIVSTGVSAQLTPTLLIYVDYDGQLGREIYDSNAVTGGCRISF